MVANKLKSQYGAALVEFVIVGLLLITIMCGIIEVSMYMKDCSIANMAARDGARSLALGRTSTDSLSRTTGCDITGGISSSNVIFTYCSTTTGTFTALPADTNGQNGVPSGYYISCSVRKPHLWATALFAPLFPKTSGSPTANAQYIMQRE